MTRTTSGAFATKRVSALNHPNVATLYDFLVWNGLPVAVMEFIDGETLQALVERRGPIPAHEALPIFTQALRGVAAGHRRGIVHRDLKPANLMITADGTVKVTDFGIAKMQNASGLTPASTRVGSTSYMSPEQILGRAVDERTDIYGLGGTLYELLSGRPPFQGDVAFEIESAHVREVPPPPTQYAAHIPPAVVAAVMRALAKNPADRFASTEEFMQALPELHGVAYVESSSDATRVRPLSATPVQVPRAATPPVPPAAASGAPAIAASPAATWVQTIRIAPPATQPTRTVRIERPSTPPALDPPAEPAGQPPTVRGRLPLYAGGAVVALLGVAMAGWLTRGRAPEAARTPETTLRAAASAPASVGPAAASSLASAPVPVPAPAPSSAVAAATVVPIATAAIVTVSSAPIDRQPAAAAASARAPRANLSGTWTGAYADADGRSQLRVLGLSMEQARDGSISGTLNYEGASGVPQKCTLERSNYSAQMRRLRLIVHCAGSAHPKYLNVPLDFHRIDPATSTLSGGHLALHLDDGIVVNLRRGVD